MLQVVSALLSVNISLFIFNFTNTSDLYLYIMEEFVTCKKQTKGLYTDRRVESTYS